MTTTCGTLTAARGKMAATTRRTSRPALKTLLATRTVDAGVSAWAVVAQRAIASTTVRCLLLAVPPLGLPLDLLLWRRCSIRLVEIGLCAGPLLGQVALTCPILLIEVGLRAPSLLS